MSSPEKKNRRLKILTIGHSNRSIEDFLALLGGHGVGALADIRRFPASRKFPHFNRKELTYSLEEKGIQYRWMEALGGRRSKAKDGSSLNAGLRVDGFRNYADYMRTEEFANGVQELLALAETSSTAIMCAEKLFWSCHRRILSDQLCSQGIHIEHLLDAGNLRPHTMTSEAIVGQDGIVVYPATPPSQGSLL